MQIIRQFSVQIIAPEYYDLFEKDWNYEVLGVDVDEDGVTWLLLVSKRKELIWVESNKCVVASLYDRT